VRNHLQAALLMLALSSCTLPLHRESPPQPGDPTLRIVTGGEIRGEGLGEVVAFKGIPFAAPPVDTNRWRDPQPVIGWTGVRTTTAFAPSCKQNPPLPGMHLESSENCLYLNVWGPKNPVSPRLPVMVWIYGGSFIGGSTLFTPGEALARRGVVVVSLAYRVGIFGFLAHPALSAEGRHASGNYGLKDQIAALQWVRNNIAAFGGDPNNVTVFGESAGGKSVSLLAASPPARGLFQKIISESGGSFAPLCWERNQVGLNMHSLADAEREGVAALRALGAPDIDAARRLSAQDLLRDHETPWWPVLDHRVIVGDNYDLYQKGQYYDTPVLIGTNSDEGGLFVRQTSRASFDEVIRGLAGHDAAILAAYPHDSDDDLLASSRNLIRDSHYAWPTWTWARLQSARPHANPVFVYYFDYAHARSLMSGPVHGAEIPYVFGMKTGHEAEDDAMTNLLMSYWVNFARTGDPNGKGLPAWPRFKPDAGQVLYLDPDAHAAPVPNLAQLQAMDDYFLWRRTQ
jgi:para-nitrobenzyl esterase